MSTINLQLGKLPRKKDPRNLKLFTYLKKLPRVPRKALWHNFKPISDWGMGGNDKYGNCVIVTAAHIIDCARANESKIYKRIPDDKIISLSTEMKALRGYYILSRLKRWRKRGMFGSKIIGFVDIEPITDAYLKAAIFLFGHADIGVLMPVAWENSTFWDVGRGRKYKKNSWGGHSIPLLGYRNDREHGLIYYACTWGRIIEITSEAIAKYCDEAYVSLVKDWFAKDKKSPSGFRKGKLLDDLKRLD